MSWKDLRLPTVSSKQVQVSDHLTLATAPDASSPHHRLSRILIMAQPEQSPALLTIVLDTNPAAWALLSDTLPLSTVVANLLVFINAHLACNYTNKIAVIASHPDKAQWLYPPSTEQKTSHLSTTDDTPDDDDDDLVRPTKRVKLNGPPTTNGDTTPPDGSKYRPFRLIETAILNSLNTLISTTSPETLSATTSNSTMIAGALTLALTYINRDSTAYSESIVGVATDPTTTQTADTSSPSRLQSRILLINASPTTDLAHQYIPIMNAIFACQRLSIPIDILSIPLPTTNTNTATPSQTENSTVFLQQASDATSGIFLPFTLPHPLQPNRISTSTALLTHLLGPLLPSPQTRTHLTSPTQINIDFRAACFCHRRVIDLGYVCSICLSIFCEPPPENECLTCGTKLGLGEGVGRRPVVVPKRKKKKRMKGLGGGGEGSSRVGTPVPG